MTGAFDEDEDDEVLLAVWVCAAWAAAAWAAAACAAACA